MTKFGKVENSPSIAEQMDYAPAIEMGIKNAPTQLIVKYLTDMYTYPLEAAMRETVSNAIDASTRNGGGASGVKFGFSDSMFRHDEVRNPFRGLYGDDDWFIVVDDGAGMDSEVLTSVYTQYGMSDKRGENSTTGAFGLGAKSPLAYCNEFHVVTKAADGACRYIACYRTVTGDLIADSPRVMDGYDLTISIKRNANNLIVPQGMNVADAATQTVTISDVFGDSTGTIVCFPIKWNGMTKARAIASGINDLLRGVNGAHCYMTDDNEQYVFHELTETVIADDNGNKINAAAYYVRNASLFNTLSDVQDLTIWANGGKETFEIGFKVGDWLYIPNGGAWRYDDSLEKMLALPQIIIDVPSSALSFVPSRDTILENDNTRIIIESIRKKIAENTHNPQWFGRFINWIASQQANSYSGYAPFRFASMNSNGATCNLAYPSADNGETCLTIWFEPSSNKYGWFNEFSVDVDLREICGPIGRNYYDVLSEESAVTLILESNSANVYRVNGPVMASPYVESWITSPNSWYNKKYCGNISGMGVAKAKTAADGLVYGKHHVTSCCINGQDKIPATSGMPLAFVINNLKCIMNGYRTAAIIVDASATKVSRIRGAAGRIADKVLSKQDKFMSYEVAMIVIPPKADGSRVESDKIIERAKEDLRSVGINKIEVINKSDIDSIMKNDNRLESRELDEIRKLFHNSEVLRTMADGRRGYVSGNSEFDLILKKASSSYIVAVPDESFERGPRLGRAIVNKLAYMFPDSFPSSDYIVCVSERHYKEKRIALAKKAGFKILLDRVGEHGKDGVYASDILIPVSNNDKGRWAPRYKFVYNGKITDEMSEYLQNKLTEEYNTSIVKSIGALCSNTYYLSSRTSLTPDDLDNIISGVTYGTYGYHNMSAESKTSWGAYDGIEFVKYDNAAERAKLMTEVGKIKDICTIWHTVLLDHGIILTSAAAPKHRNNDYAGFLRGIGEFVGLDSIVMGYNSGVPIADILAGEID